MGQRLITVLTVLLSADLFLSLKWMTLFVLLLRTFLLVSIL